MKVIQYVLTNGEKIKVDNKHFDTIITEEKYYIKGKTMSYIIPQRSVCYVSSEYIPDSLNERIKKRWGE